MALAAELEIAVVATVDALVLPMAAAAAHRALVVEGAPAREARLRHLGARPADARVFDLRFDPEALRFTARG